MTTETTRRRRIPTPTTFRSPEGNTRFRVHNGRYDTKTARRICERLMGMESLAAICADPRMPGLRTVTRWLARPDMADFREMYYFSRRVQAELRVDEIFTIADDTTKDWEKIYNKDGDLIDLKPNNEAIQRSRVRIDTRKWYAAKLVPRIYGDNTQVDLDVTGDLAELLKAAANKNTGLPEPIDG